MKNLIKSKILRLLDSGNLVECENEHTCLFKGKPARLKIGRVCIDVRKNAISGNFYYSVEYLLASRGILVKDLTEQDYEDIRKLMLASFEDMKRVKEYTKLEKLKEDEEDFLKYLQE